MKIKAMKAEEKSGKPLMAIWAAGKCESRKRWTMAVGVNTKDAVTEIFVKRINHIGATVVLRHDGIDASHKGVISILRDGAVMRHRTGIFT